MGLSRLVSIVVGWLQVPRRVVVLATVGCCTLAASSAPALATRNHTFSASIGSLGSGAGELSSPEGVAVDNSSGPAAGDIYVADTGNARVDQFDSSGHFLRAWGWGVADGKEEFEICTTVCQKGIVPTDPEHSKPGQFDTPKNIAVDGSSGPSAGDVYVGDPATALVQKFNSSGELVEDWGDSTPIQNGQLAGTNDSLGSFRAKVTVGGVAVDGSGSLWVFAAGGVMAEFEQNSDFVRAWGNKNSGGPAGIAVDSTDDLYIAGAAANLIEKVGPNGEEIGNVTPFQGEGAIVPTGIVMDMANNELYVGVGGSMIERIASSCEPAHGVCPVAETFGSSQLNGATGLAVLSAGEVIYVAQPD